MTDDTKAEWKRKAIAWKQAAKEFQKHRDELFRDRAALAAVVEEVWRVFDPMFSGAGIESAKTLALKIGRIHDAGYLNVLREYRQSVEHDARCEGYFQGWKAAESILGHCVDARYVRGKPVKGIGFEGYPGEFKEWVLGGERK